MTTENWATSVATLVMVKQRLHEVDSQQLWQYRLPSIAASESELTAVEQRLGEPLDPSHRAFLCHASGWPAFFQTVDLFGAPDLLGGSRWDHAMAMLGAVEDDVLAASNVRRQHLLPIACSPVDLDLFVITRRAAPEPGVVLWLAGYVVERFSNFEEYFAAMIDYNRREVDALDKHNRQP